MSFRAFCPQLPYFCHPKDFRESFCVAGVPLDAHVRGFMLISITSLHPMYIIKMLKGLRLLSPFLISFALLFLPFSFPSSYCSSSQMFKQLAQLKRNWNKNGTKQFWTVLFQFCFSFISSARIVLCACDVIWRRRLTSLCDANKTLMRTPIVASACTSETFRPVCQSPISFSSWDHRDLIRTAMFYVLLTLVKRQESRF